MSQHGGKRNNSGRKKGKLGNHTIEALEARKIMVAMIAEKIVPMTAALIKKVIKRGDSYAAKELFDRGFGKVSVPIDLREVKKLIKFDDE